MFVYLFEYSQYATKTISGFLQIRTLFSQLYVNTRHTDTTMWSKDRQEHPYTLCSLLCNFLSNVRKEYTTSGICDQEAKYVYLNECYHTRYKIHTPTKRILNAQITAAHDTLIKISWTFFKFFCLCLRRIWINYLVKLLPNFKKKYLAEEIHKCKVIL